MNEIFKYIQSDYYRYSGVKCGDAKLICKHPTPILAV